MIKAMTTAAPPAHGIHSTVAIIVGPTSPADRNAPSPKCYQRRVRWPTQKFAMNASILDGESGRGTRSRADVRRGGVNEAVIRLWRAMICDTRIFDFSARGDDDVRGHSGPAT
jgi:hypothetical protein